MTFRNMHATHKMLATIAIFVLMGIELNDIRKDRAKTDAQQGADRKEASENFTAIATGIKTAISNSSEQFHETVAGLKSTLNATRQTIENTRPRAILEFADMSPVPQYLPIATNHSIVFNVTFINAGNEEAKQLDHLARIYVGKLDDAETQRLMLLDFTKRWKEGQRTNNPFIKTKKGVTIPQIMAPYPATKFLSFESDKFTENDSQDIANGTKTLYMMFRIAWTDITGYWISDACRVYQDRPFETTVLHSCMFINAEAVRYRDHNRITRLRAMSAKP